MITSLKDNPEHAELVKEMQGELAHPSEVPFGTSIINGAKTLTSMQGLGILLCSPLLSYFKTLWRKSYALLDTDQDKADLFKWVENKYNKLNAYLRGEVKYQYAGENPNEMGEIVERNDIIGQESLKQLIDKIIDYLQHPHKYERAQVAIEKAILLYGPPQTGKTYIVKYIQTQVARAIGDRVAFIPVTSADLEQFSIEDMFYLAGRNAPCILFIDELEMIGAKRDGAKGQKTRELLTCINGLMSQSTSKDVFVIGATNKPEDLDFALTCKGRFGVQIPFTYPSHEDRVTFIKRELRNRGVQHISNDLIKIIANETEARSYNAISSVMNTAFGLSMVDLRLVTQKDFEIALDMEIRNILELGSLSEHEKEVIATYQIGIGLARHLLETQAETTCLTIRPVKEKIRYNEAAFSFTETNSNNNENEKLLPIKKMNLYSMVSPSPLNRKKQQSSYRMKILKKRF